MKRHVDLLGHHYKYIRHPTAGHAMRRAWVSEGTTQSDVIPERKKKVDQNDKARYQRANLLK
jgi:hypothetical protein